MYMQLKLQITVGVIDFSMLKSISFRGAQKSISFRGPKLWNQLSSDVRLAPSLSTFKRRFKDVVEG